MKVTAIIPDEIIKDVQKYTEGKNITDSLIKALNDWLYAKRIENLNDNLARKPVQFKKGYSAEGIRNLNKRV
jgi:hypothetical protein